jgi:sulfur carrier protein ThiS
MNQAFAAHCLTVRNPFHPGKDRDFQVLDEPIAIRELTPKTDKPFLIVRNGDYVLRADWDQEVKDGDMLAVVFLPQGGGDGGSDIGRVIAMIVVAIASYYTGGLVAGYVGGSNAAAWGYAASVAVSLVGSPSINIQLEAAQ